MYPRAALMAIMTASLPLLVKRIRSNADERPASASASSTSDSVGSEAAIRRPAWAWIAATISGWQWPWINEV